MLRGRISIHAPREGERQAVFVCPRFNDLFQSTLPARGSDYKRPILSPSASNFNPRSPRGGATHRKSYRIRRKQFQSTLPARGSDRPDFTSKSFFEISIHAPREGERQQFADNKTVQPQFQSTLPARGSDGRLLIATEQLCAFQSTLPARGSDRPKSQKKQKRRHFNPRSPRGGATPSTVSTQPRVKISIHAPREGERPFPKTPRDLMTHFNPRSPRGGATLFVGFLIFGLIISIHAPREGERPWLYVIIKVPKQFQSTLPARGSDVKAKTFCLIMQYFNPRSPRGGATDRICSVDTATGISIHAPREGERPPAFQVKNLLHTFQSTLPARGSDGFIINNSELL